MTNKTLLQILKIGLVTLPVLIIMNYSNCFASQLPWFGDNEYRIFLNISESNSEYSTVPLSFTFEQVKIRDRFNLNLDEIELASIRVVQYDNKDKPVVYSKARSEEQYYIPTRLNFDEHVNKIRISWRVNINDDNTFAVYFSRKGYGLQKPLDAIPVIGDGDFLSYGQRNVKAPISGGYNESIDAVDFDKDGDIDLFVGFSGVPEKQGIYYYENIGSQNNPLLTMRKKVFDSKRDFQLLDWDKDGESEIIFDGEIFNLNKSSNKPIISRSDKLPKFSSAKDIFIDWDGDNVDDLLSTYQINPRFAPSASVWDPSLPPYTVLGVWMGNNERNSIVFCKNIGSNIKPVYDKSIPVNAGGIPIEVFGSLHISAGDLDNDGDKDLVVGNRFQLISFRNEGTSISPKLEKGRLLKTLDNQNPFSIYTKPRLADWDGDGRIDILLGNEDGRPTWIKNLGDDKYDIERFIIQLDPDIDFGCLSVPVVCDWDSDGDYDLLAGNSSGFVEYIENISSSATKFIFRKSCKMIADSKEIRILAYNSGSIQGPKEAKYGYTMPEVADWDKDGDLDLLLSDIKGEHHYYKNIGTKNKPTLAKAEPLKVAWTQIPPKPSFNWRQPEATELVTAPRCRPAVIDWNSDGVLDYVAIDHEGYLAFYEAYLENDEKWLKHGLRCFKNQDGTPIRISEFVGAKSGRARIVFADWDGDGDLDIIHNAHRLFDDTPALLKKVKHAGWFENKGGEGEPKFVWQGEIIKKDFPLTSEHSTSPEVVDFDGDGKLDLFLGGEDGRITCFHRAFIEDDLPVLRLIKMEKRNN
jgi:hypothetical protein